MARSTDRKLGPQAKKWLAEVVASGQYANEAEAIEALIKKERRRQSAIDRIDELLDESLSSGPGEVVDEAWKARLVRAFHERQRTGARRRASA